MRGLTRIGILIIIMGTVWSCKKDTRPNYQFFPQMYVSPSYETYGAYDIFPNEQSALIPVEGTIARGHTLYAYNDTNEDYELAKVELTNPLEASAMDGAKAKELYDVYCGICHGTKGDGQGYLVKQEKILGIPSYADREITEGSVYHVIYYGRNAMGSYANQLDEDERWLVSNYVMQLRGELTN